MTDYHEKMQRAREIDERNRKTWMELTGGIVDWEDEKVIYDPVTLDLSEKPLCEHALQLQKWILTNYPNLPTTANAEAIVRAEEQLQQEMRRRSQTCNFCEGYIYIYELNKRWRQVLHEKYMNILIWRGDPDIANYAIMYHPVTASKLAYIPIDEKSVYVMLPVDDILHIPSAKAVHLWMLRTFPDIVTTTDMAVIKEAEEAILGKHRQCNYYRYPKSEADALFKVYTRWYSALQRKAHWIDSTIINRPPEIRIKTGLSPQSHQATTRSPVTGSNQSVPAFLSNLDDG